MISRLMYGQQCALRTHDTLWAPAHTTSLFPSMMTDAPQSQAAELLSLKSQILSVLLCRCRFMFFEFLSLAMFTYFGCVLTRSRLA